MGECNKICAGDANTLFKFVIFHGTGAGGRLCEVNFRDSRLNCNGECNGFGWDWVDSGANSMSCLVINTNAFFNVSSLPAWRATKFGRRCRCGHFFLSFSFLIRIVRARWGWNYSAKLIFRIFCIRKRFGFVHRLLNGKTNTRKHQAIQLLIAVHA